MNSNKYLFNIICKSYPISIREICSRSVWGTKLMLIVVDGISEKEYFTWCCENGRIRIAKWLYKYYCMHYRDKIFYLQNAFHSCCKNGHLNVAGWLYSIGGTDIYNHPYHGNSAFELCCLHGHIKIAKLIWMRGLTQSEISQSLTHASIWL